MSLSYLFLACLLCSFNSCLICLRYYLLKSELNSTAIGSIAKFIILLIWIVATVELLLGSGMIFFENEFIDHLAQGYFLVIVECCILVTGMFRANY